MSLPTHKRTHSTHLDNGRDFVAQSTLVNKSRRMSPSSFAVESRAITPLSSSE
jgi:hypothetical protein